MGTPRRHILHVYKDYWPPIVGGIEKIIHWLAHGCADEYDVSVLVCSRSRRYREAQDGPVRIHQAGEWARVSSAPAAPAFPFHLRRLKADILHFHHPNPTGELAYLLARPSGRVVVTYHSDIVRQRTGLRVYGPWLRRFLRKADVILPTSPPYVESSEILRPLASRCQVVPLGIPLAGFAASQDRLQAAKGLREHLGAGFLALFVGQFREYKGLPYLIEALSRVPGVTAVLIGDGPVRNDVEAAIRRFGVEDRVHLPGRLPDEVVVNYYHACDVFVLPSHRRSEAFGIVQVEAMASGKPVISTRLDTGVPFVNRDGETGLVVTPGDAEALARALEWMRDHPGDRARLGEAARRRAGSEFSLERMIERVKAVYAGLPVFSGKIG